ncbi:MAG TPA: GNAT family N-acetyltransferase [Plantibacter sp.]|uniref:GNAT family N-acetyltransferase n=1 Tax=unclassified Plantibacter TaxID=2624265 RepID=UPI002C17ED40|nr:GNAT family N-acetyltransferase [Plantibacter sp.]
MSTTPDIPAGLPALPQHPEIARWRPALESDIDALVALSRAMDPFDNPHRVTSRDEIADEFDHEWIDMETDSLLAIAPDGEVVAFAMVVLAPSRDVSVYSYVFGGVHPDWRGRGIGRLVLSWSLERSEQQLDSVENAAPRSSRAYVDEHNPSAARLFERHGFSVARYFTIMERDLSLPVDEIPVPEGVRLVQYGPEYADRTRVARNDSFRDHWGSLETVPPMWQQFVGGSHFRDELSVIGVEADGRVVGFTLAEVDEASWDAQGFTSAYIALVGTVRDWRGRRLAPALLAAALTRIAAAGLERATLEVDTASPTGALGLYERQGFVATTRELAYVRER